MLFIYERQLCIYFFNRQDKQQKKLQDNIDI